ncbi:1-aminocyclopropane-1-carboxylate deaminase/D-cysteine desulfhydrase [Tichowtungia aerotolerans]|uniref:Pyridoxal-phosphate dependent enzyme n=1 Tax=Tichowtungia aerotolerans TaxID=2697043 RepID=A0A6P1M551_9BACT|nr:pyridoxal-phosphate dependent enzyme [Tichowtungia aerotolerans]QHI68123.1 pyridoxal-phosphate dependent enzyme [Tichowtungia aerotolerans]
MNDLFSRFSRAALAELPTPVVELPVIEKTVGHDRLFMKRDDLSGPVYGGNKVRKLEFLLGEALDQGRKTVITYGAAGSNHALATAICCRQLGLNAISILAPQEPTDHVRKNLRMGQAVGAELHLCSDFNEFPEATRQIVERCKERDGVEPTIIPAGGTNAVGALGFVNAALELAAQMQPDVIYVPMGTGGTVAGLQVGFLLTDFKPRIEAIRVVERAFRDESHIKALCDELCEKLEIQERVALEDITIRDEFFGDGYGIATPEGRGAVDVFQNLENVVLENTYTGKTAAALLHDLRAGMLDGQTVLYWNTLNSRDFSDEITGVCGRDLPPEFAPYFS